MNVSYSLQDLKTCLFKHWRETVPIIFTDFDRISEKKLFQDERIEKILLKPLENFLINDYKTDIVNHELSCSTKSRRVCKSLLKHNQFYFTCMYTNISFVIIGVERNDEIRLIYVKLLKLTYI